MVEEERESTGVAQLKLRLGEALHQRLKQQASEHKRTLNSEIASRLEESFRRSEQVEELFGGHHNVVLFRFLTGEIGLIELRSGRPWHEDRNTLLQCADAVVAAMGRLISGFSTIGAAEEFKRLRDQAEKRLHEYEEVRQRNVADPGQAQAEDPPRRGNQ
jgi:hypothetical protein